MSWKFGSASLSLSTSSSSARIAFQLVSSVLVQGNWSGSKKVFPPTSDRRPIHFSIGSRIFSPTAMVHSTIFSRHCSRTENLLAIGRDGQVGGEDSGSTFVLKRE